MEKITFSPADTPVLPVHMMSVMSFTWRHSHSHFNPTVLVTYNFGYSNVEDET